MNTIQEMIDLYQSGKGIYFLNKKYKISQEKIKQILKANNIHIRNKQEAVIAKNQTSNLLKNHSYFKTENKNMAWLLGFIAADGSIEKDRHVIKISLSAVDKEILEKIRKEINLESSVKDYVDSQGFAKSKIQWSSKEHKDDLAAYNIIPQKTFILKSPAKLNKQFIIDFIRGFWDGDGSITIIKNNYNTLEWQVTSASKEILEFFVEYLYSEFNIPRVNVHSFVRGDRQLYILRYSTKASLQLHHLMYDNVTENDLFIKRKKEKYDAIIKEKLNLK